MKYETQASLPFEWKLIRPPRGLQNGQTIAARHA